MDDMALARFGFRIRPVEDRWEWVASGGVSGYAATRAEAAAAVISALARAAAQGPAAGRAA